MCSWLMMMLGMIVRLGIDELDFFDGSILRLRLDLSFFLEFLSSSSSSRSSGVARQPVTFLYLCKEK